MKTLYISDLDGTLLNREAELSTYTTQQLQRLMAGGMRFTAATARTWETVGKILGDLNLQDPVILMNGVCIYDARAGHYLKVNAIDEASVCHVIRAMKQYGVHGFMYNVKDDRLRTYYEVLDTPWLVDFYEERRKKYDKEFRKVQDFYDKAGETIIYFSLFNTKEVLDPIYQEIREDAGLHIEYYKDVYSDSLWYLEVVSASSSKADAVQYVKEYGGYDQLVVFGDNYNDLSMFQAADAKIAVGNARDVLKEAADEVIGCNTEDGVVKYLIWREEHGLL